MKTGLLVVGIILIVLAVVFCVLAALLTTKIIETDHPKALSALSAAFGLVALIAGIVFTVVSSQDQKPNDEKSE